MFDPNDPLFWVLVAFLAFVALLALLPRAGDRSAKCSTTAPTSIRKELDEARKLREDAQSLLADYQRKAREAETEAQTIIEQAKREAEAAGCRVAQGACREPRTPFEDRRGKDCPRRSSGGQRSPRCRRRDGPRSGAGNLEDARRRRDRRQR